MTKENLLKFKELWEKRKAKGDSQADSKLAKIERALKFYEASKPNVLVELKKQKK